MALCDNEHGHAMSGAPPSAEKVNRETDVLIVGLGSVGAALANLLGRLGVRVVVVERNAEILAAPRAITLDNEALRILQWVGLEEGDFDKVGIPHVRMCSPWLGEFARINTLGGLDGHPKLVTFYQPDLERALRDKLRTHQSVQLSLGTTLTGFTEHADGVVAQISEGPGCHTEYHARYLVGADGASSRVRELIGQHFDGKTYAEDWLVVDARRVARPIDHVEFLCDHRRPTPHMIAPGGRERWEFMLRPGETREQMESDACIRDLLAPWGIADDMDIERRAVYRFHARAADAFSRGRVFLVGDAAHITPPFVGQGLVSGLRDAANLGWKLAWVVHGRAGASILKSYDRERRPHARAMIDMAKFAGRLVMPRNAAVALLTHGIMRAIRWIPPLRRYFEELGIKPKNLFAEGLFVRGRSGARLVRGSLLRQGYVRNPKGELTLSDNAFGDSLALIGFGCDPYPSLDAGLQERFLTAGGKIVHVAHRGQQVKAPFDRVWEDLEGVFLPGTAPIGWVVIVRPDRTILHDGPITAVNQLVRESLALLETTTGEFEVAAIECHSREVPVP
jgi:3-(3-hydroxy-phenyl)propionate hydroxylase